MSSAAIKQCHGLDDSVIDVLKSIKSNHSNVCLGLMLPSGCPQVLELSLD